MLESSFFDVVKDLESDVSQSGLTHEVDFVVSGFLLVEDFVEIRG